MIRLMRFAVAIVGAVCLPVAASAATVPDGSFENPATGGGAVYNPSVAGVTFTNYAGVTTPAASGFATAPDGSQVGFIQNLDKTSAITFTLSDLIAGTTYNASFFLARETNVPVDPLQVRLNGTLLSNSANAQTLFVAPGTAWTKFTTSSFTAAGTSATLSFTGTAELGGNFAVGIDAVALNDLSTPAAVPEPATWAMMIGGLGLGGAALRRRRGRPAYA